MYVSYPCTFSLLTLGITTVIVQCVLQVPNPDKMIPNCKDKDVYRCIIVILSFHRTLCPVMLASSVASLQ